MYGIILAGGSGSRLWPLSRELYPKQLLNLNSDKSLLQATFERLKYCTSDIVSITNIKHAPNVKMQLGEFCENPIVLSEPVAKNTAPAIVLATKYIMQTTNSDPVIIVVPSDHLIKDNEKFLSTVKKGEKLAQEGYIVTFGIQPSYPETGYGYIEAAKQLGSEAAKSDNSETSQEHLTDTNLSTLQPFNPSTNTKVIRFVEKPDLETAKEYLKAGTYYWNSGIFMFKASVLFGETIKHAPEIAKLSENFNFKEKCEIPFIEFDKMPSISIDYAIMEKSDKIALVRLESDWNDLGSWQSIYDISPKDENGNVFVGHVLDENSKNSFVYSSSKLVATIGLEDTVIVETEDAILACKKTELRM